MLLENAKFITTEEPRADVAPLFRRAFSLSGKVKSASLSITARGLYEAHINGKRVGKFVLAPGWTSYRYRVQVQTYDVTDMLGEENTIDVLLGKGWHFGTIERKSYSDICDPCIIASLDITYEDGRVESIATDSTWQYANTGILYNDLYNGETFDSNVTLEGWKSALETDGKKEALEAQQGEEVTEHEEIYAINYFITPKGERIIDFGQEVTGYVCFRSVGGKGDKIVIDHAEILDKHGNFYNENYREAKARIEYICDGDKSRWYHPTFSFYGFRYIRLTEYPTDELYVGDFKAIVVHSDMKRTGRFKCSDTMINRLYENIIWGHRGNFLDVPTDCPQRDERAGWTADAQIFCRTAAYNYDVNKFFRKWLRDMSLDQHENGKVPQVIPSIWHPQSGYTWGDGAFAWGDAATICPWEMYVAYGDKGILEQQFDTMKRWCDYYYGKGETPEEWASGAQYGDWLALDHAEGSYQGATSYPMLATMFLIYSCTLTAKTARVLGADADEAKYAAIRDKVRAVFFDTYVGEDGMLTCNTQTAYACALCFDLAPDRAKYARHLADKVHDFGDRIQTGFIGTAYIMDALSDNGYVDVAYKLLTQTEFPSWLFSVRKGATTVWEHWDGLKPNGDVWSKDMNSFNHYAYGAVASWMYSVMCGIKPDEEKPGYDNIKIAPVPNECFDYAYAELDTKHGTIKSGWKKTEGGYEISVTVPEGATADITVGGKTEHVCSGEYVYNV